MEREISRRIRTIGIEKYLELYEDDIKQFYNHEGYKKLKKIISGKYNAEQQHQILMQYCFILRYFEKSTKDIVMKYVTENYPEIISFADLIENKIPYYKFIWSFFKKDEKLIDTIFNKRGFEYKKYTIVFKDKELLIYVINMAINCDYSEDIFSSEDAHKVQGVGYKPFNQFQRKMIPHGMAWYIYGDPHTYFSDMCRLFPVRMLSIEDDTKKDDEDWAKIGYREDLDCGFRSSWEANIARLFNYKGIKWKYEPYFIHLNPPPHLKGIRDKASMVKRMPSPDNPSEIVEKIIYMPDFVLEDGTIVEVKGFWDSRSKINVSQFMEQYPDKKYIVVDTDIYRCINKTYKDIISNWEDDNVGFTNDHIQVVGITLPERKNFVSQLNIGDILEIVREPQNEYDSRAIRVNDCMGNQVGYFAKDCNCIYAPKIDIGFKYQVIVEAKTPKVLQCKIKLINSDEVILPELFS